MNDIEYLLSVLDETRERKRKRLEKRMNDFDNPSMEKLQAAAEPLIKYLSENYHPHVTAIVDATHAEVLEGLMVHRTEEFLRD